MHSAKLARLLTKLPKRVSRDILSANLHEESPESLLKAFRGKYLDIAFDAMIEKMRCELKEMENVRRPIIAAQFPRDKLHRPRA